MAQSNFSNFLRNIGIREETAEKLWEGNIRTPQELASSKSSKLQEIVDDSVLTNTVHPVLQQYAFPITMAADPYKKAISLLRKHCGEPEPVQSDGAPEINGHFLQSDAKPLSGSQHKPYGTGQFPSQTSHPSTGTHTARTTRTTIFSTQSQPRDTKQVTNHGESRNIVISGGNFVQSSFLSDKPIVINNTNTTVQATSYIDTAEAKLERRNEKVDPSWIKLDDCTFSTANLHISDTPDYWPTNDTQVNKVDARTAEQRHDDAYPVTQWNSNRALLINITKFATAKSERQGAEVDAYQLRIVLEQLGFTVTMCENKTKREIEQTLREFQSPSRNQNTSISLVFIGSHGDRHNNEDWFIGSDNQPISVSQVINGFTGSSCPSLFGKPKIFFFQFCRQDTQKMAQARQQPMLVNQQPGNRVRHDAIGDVEENVMHYPAHNEADMLQAFATAAGTKAYRDTKEGSWFVTALCKALKEHAHNDDLLSIMTRVNSQVMTQLNYEQGKVAVQMAEFKSTLKKKVRFYPQ